MLAFSRHLNECSVNTGNYTVAGSLVCMLLECRQLVLPNYKQCAYLYETFSKNSNIE